jgi:hypothetical protein
VGHHRDYGRRQFQAFYVCKVSKHKIKPRAENSFDLFSLFIIVPNSAIQGTRFANTWLRQILSQDAI